jgi:ABC-type uncharacterized transport system substrate-binding protein
VTGIVVNPADATNTENTLRGVQEAARVIGLQVHVLNASTSREIDAAFAALAGERQDALFGRWWRILWQPPCAISHLGSAQ